MTMDNSSSDELKTSVNVKENEATELTETTELTGLSCEEPDDVSRKKVENDANDSKEEEEAKITEITVNAQTDNEEKSCVESNDKVSNPPDQNKNSESCEVAGEQLPDTNYTDHITYNGDGVAIYKDPKTNYIYKWCSKENKWVPCNNSTQSQPSESNPYENDHYKWCSTTKQWLPKDPAQNAATETEFYKWDAEKGEWIPKPQATSDSYGFDSDGNRIHTDKDGVEYIWDTSKNAWFPKIDEEFMARYQMNYGFVDNTESADKEEDQKEEEHARDLESNIGESSTIPSTSIESAGTALKRKLNQEPPKWFDMDPTHNTKVYVWNLPLDITIDEFSEVMGKCGMIMRDPQTQKYKLKLYTEPDGQLKGDGLCDYIKVESVDLALKILDEYNLRGNKIRVQRAKFEMRGEYNPALKPKRRKKDKEKLQKIKEKLFDWRPEKMRGERTKSEKIVIIKNLFHPKIFEEEVQLILDYQNDLREECSKCGTVRKVIIYDSHEEGIAQINMSSPEEADVVIQMMHGRFFGKRQLSAEHWDGKTKYKVTESETDAQKRLSSWDKFLEDKAEANTTCAEVNDESKNGNDCEKLENS